MNSNEALFQRAQKVIPGGVNSPVRAFRAVGGTPRFISRAHGAYMVDAEGKRYIDYIGSWGPMILGHGHPAVLDAVQKAALDGFSFGAPTEREVELAEEILKLVPSMEQVRLVSSGTEAAMSALRLARGATGRNKFIKFEGCYHGHADALLVKAGSGLATFGNPTSAGVPDEVVRDTVVLEYNNLAQLEEAFSLHGREMACVMIEPIAGNMNFVRASVPFMSRLRELCTQHGALLVKAGSGLATFGNPTSAGVPAEVVRDTVVLEYNNLVQLEEAFDLHGRELACVMIEPIAGNMNFVRASVPFMTRLRELCTQHGTLLVFDEVMSGFRVALGGAQSLYAQAIPGFAPDISVFGKVIGGGMPLAAFGGKRAVMEQLAPLGAVYQAGTLSGNPVATACGLATLREIRKPGFFDALAARTRSLVDGLLVAARDAGVPMVGDSEGGMFGFFFTGTLPQNQTAVMATDKARFNRFFHAMLDGGVYLAPALYEAGFVSAAHTAEDIAATVQAARTALR